MSRLKYLDLDPGDTTGAYYCLVSVVHEDGRREDSFLVRSYQSLLKLVEMFQLQDRFTAIQLWTDLNADEVQWCIYTTDKGREVSRCTLNYGNKGPIDLTAIKWLTDKWGGGNTLCPLS